VFSSILICFSSCTYEGFVAGVFFASINIFFLGLKFWEQFDSIAIYFAVLTLGHVGIMYLVLSIERFRTCWPLARLGIASGGDKKMVAGKHNSTASRGRVVDVSADGMDDHCMSLVPRHFRQTH
jgi:hypothetical protein